MMPTTTTNKPLRGCGVLDFRWLRGV